MGSCIGEVIEERIAPLARWSGLVERTRRSTGQASWASMATRAVSLASFNHGMSMDAPSSFSTGINSAIQHLIRAREFETAWFTCEG